MSADAWFPFQAPSPNARFRLFCFPFAGGGASAFRSWASSPHAAHVEVVPIELPGHGMRLHEPLVSKWGPLISALGTALTPVLDVPYAFFGHSLGAKIAFELARELRRAQREGPSSGGPTHLFLSASAAPQHPARTPARSTFSRAEFVAELRRLGGTPEIVFESEDMLDLFVPVVRADFELVDGYVLSPDVPLTAPFTAFCGRRDQDVPPAKMEGWREHTSGRFSLHVLEEGHFYVEPARDRILSIVAQLLGSYGSG